MPSEQVNPRLIRLVPCAHPAALCLLLSVAIAGCHLHIDDDTLALDAATTPVLDQAAEAYRAANALHNLRMEYDALADFDAPGSVYNPRDIKVLLSPKDIGVRLEVLQGFQLYVQTLCAITSGTNPKALGPAAVSVGGQLSSLANTLVPTIEKAAGAENSATTAVISSGTQKAVTTGLDALGRFLIERKVKSELPAKIATMDTHLQALASLVEGDIDVLAGVEHRDYERIINLQTLMLRKNDNMSATERRAEIMKLPDFVRQEREAEEKLGSLRAAVVLLAQTHQQLVADAQGKTPESFKEKLEDLASAASELGTFYSSLSN